MQPFAVRRVRIEIEVSGASRAVEATPSSDAGQPLDDAQGDLVLLVTDDADFREVAERALRSQGFRVVTAAHAGHALLACLSADRVDVLVTELSMQDMSGPGLAQRVRRHYPDLPVVYIARCGTPASQGVLVRPFTRDDLVQQIDLALAAALA